MINVVAYLNEELVYAGTFPAIPQIGSALWLPYDKSYIVEAVIFDRRIYEQIIRLHVKKLSLD